MLLLLMQLLGMGGGGFAVPPLDTMPMAAREETMPRASLEADYVAARESPYGAALE